MAFKPLTAWHLILCCHGHDLERFIVVISLGRYETRETKRDGSSLYSHFPKLAEILVSPFGLLSTSLPFISTLFPSLGDSTSKSASNLLFNSLTYGMLFFYRKMGASRTAFQEQQTCILLFHLTVPVGLSTLSLNFYGSDHLQVHEGH